MMERRSPSARRAGQSGRTRLELIALLAEIAGAVAVVVSVAYLGIQIRDNNRLLHTQAHYNAMEVAQKSLAMLVSTPGLSDIVQECDWKPDEVAEADWQRCKNYYFMQVNGWEYTYYQHLDDTVPKEFWIGLDGYFNDQCVKKPGYARFWEETAIGFGEPFRSYVEERIAKNPWIQQAPKPE